MDNMYADFRRGQVISKLTKLVKKLEKKYPSLVTSCSDQDMENLLSEKDKKQLNIVHVELRRLMGEEIHQSDKEEQVSK